MRSQLKGNECYMALNLGMSKAYNKIELPYLEVVMKKMDFASKWIHLTMQCFRYVSYYIIVNSPPCRKFSPTREIRQGDPLSSCLFILEWSKLLRLTKFYEIALGQRVSNNEKTSIFFQYQHKGRTKDYYYSDCRC